MSSPVSCAKCGACLTVCPVYQVTGRESLTARGRLHLLDKLGPQRFSRAGREIFSSCLLCGACTAACPRRIDLSSRIIEARSEFSRSAGKNVLARVLIGKSLSHQSLLSALANLLQISEPLLTGLPADSGLRLKLGLIEQQGKTARRQLEEPGNVEDRGGGPLLFSGCLFSHLMPETGASCLELIGTGKGKAVTPEGQACCGLAMYSAGNLQEARRLARINIKAFYCSDRPIIVACGSCYSHLRTYPELFADDPDWQQKARTFSSRLHELSYYLKKHENQAPPPNAAVTTGRKLRVVYHDPCHLKFLPGMTEAPRRLLRSLPGIEIVELPHGSRCCGFGGMFSMAHPDLSEKISDLLVDEIETLEPDLVLTTCSGCILQLRQLFTARGLTIKVSHLANMLARKK